MKLLGVLLTLVAFLASLAVLPASAQSGFSVVSGNTLWTYDNPSSLYMFEAKKVALPITATSGTGSARGGFVVVGQSSASAFNGSSFGGQASFSGYIISDVSFVPPGLNVAALGVKTGFLANTITLFQSTDGGFTWPNTVEFDSTESRSGSISVATNGYGVAVLGGSVYRTTDGKQWGRVYSATTQTFTKAAVFDSALSVVTGFTAGVTSNTPLGFISTNAAGSWSQFTLPTLSPADASITGFVLLDRQTWALCTSGGEIWLTADGSKNWTRTLFVSNTTWTDMAYSPTEKTILAAGSFRVSRSGALAISSDQGSSWTRSGPQPDAAFTRVVSGVPTALATPSPSPSVSPSTSFVPSVTPSTSFTPSASPSFGSSPSSTPSHSPSHSVTPSRSPSHSATPSRSPSHSATPSRSPSRNPSHSATPSRSPSHSATPSRTPSASPSKHSASPSPSKHSASPTPSVTPSKGATHSPSPSLSPSPSKGSAPVSPSPSPSHKPKSDDDDGNKKMALGLGLGLGLGGAAALLVGVGLAWYLRRRFTSRNMYQPINTDV